MQREGPSLWCATQACARSRAPVAGVVERLARRADIPDELRHPHVLRHTYASRYLRRTNDLAGLQRLLGHADIRTMMHYVQAAQDELHERVERAFAREAIALDTDAWRSLRGPESLPWARDGGKKASAPLSAVALDFLEEWSGALEPRPAEGRRSRGPCRSSAA